METIILLLVLAIIAILVYHYQYKKKSILAKDAAHTISVAIHERDQKTLELIAAQANYSNTIALHNQEYLTWTATQEKEIRADANKRSRATMRGQATEHLAPYMIQGLNPKDYRFMGDPLDYLICVGSSAIHDKTTDVIEEVMLLDIKTGKSQLSKVQRRIRDAVVEGRVVFATYNTDTEALRRWPS